MNTSYYFLALPAAVMLIGGVLATFWNPSTALIAMVQHLAAGIILAAVTVEVFPAMQGAGVAPALLIGSFTAGVLFMYAVKLFGERLEAGNSTRSLQQRFNFGLIITVFIDAALDGVTIGAGFAAGEKVGFALAIGLSAEMLFLSMSLISDTINGARALAISAGLSVAILLSAILAYYFLSAMPGDNIAIVLGFSCAALLYLVTEELLIEAHAQAEKPYFMLVLFAGFVGFWAISLL